MVLWSHATARSWTVVETLKATVNGPKRTNLSRPEVQHLLTLAGRHEIDVVAVEQVSQLSRIQSSAFDIFEKLTAAHASIWIERHELETLLDKVKLNPSAHCVFSDQAHEAKRETLEHSERVGSGVAFACSKRPDR